MRTTRTILNYLFAFIGKTIAVGVAIVLVTIAWRFDSIAFVFGGFAVLVMDIGVYLMDRKKTKPTRRCTILSNLD